MYLVLLEARRARFYLERLLRSRLLISPRASDLAQENTGRPADLCPASLRSAAAAVAAAAAATTTGCCYRCCLALGRGGPGSRPFAALAATAADGRPELEELAWQRAGHRG